jgi:replicative DNA helicase
MGKTMTMLQMAQNTSEYPVIIFSLEMSSRSLMIRQISRECEIEYRDLQTGNFRQSISDLIAKSEYLTKNKIIVDDTSAMSCAQIERVCKIIHKTYGGIAAVFVDYLDIVENHEKELRHKVSYTARTLKRLAKDLNTPVVCLAQLSREVAKRTDKRPILSDIRESGKVEEEADLILFLHRPGYYDSEALDEMGNDASDLMEIIAAKNRNGNLGTAKTRIDLRFGKFTALREFNPVPEFYKAPQNNDLF